MLEVFKVPVEQLTPEAFEPFGQVISTFDEARPPLRVGTLQVREYNVTAAVADPVNPTLAEGRQRGHSACHDDAGQSFYPSRHCPSIFFVAPVQKTLEPEDKLPRLDGVRAISAVAQMQSSRVWMLSP